MRIDDPARWARADAALTQARLDKTRNDQGRYAERTMMRRRMASMYAALLLAGRDSDASKLAAAAREIDAAPGMRLELVRSAVQRGRARAEQLDWLDSAAVAEPAGPWPCAVPDG